MGLLIIGVRGLTRTDLGGKVNLILYDARVQSSSIDAMIGAVEVDMTNNFGIVYLAPKMYLKVKEFIDYIKIRAEAKGYKDFKGHNILLDIVFIGKTMNNINVEYKIEIGSIIESVKSKGVQFIKPLSKSPLTFAGEEWNVNLIDNPSEGPIAPTQAIMYEDRNKNTYIRYNDYKPVHTLDPLYNEEIEEEEP